MKNIWVRSSLLAAFLPAFAYSARAQTSPQKAAANLGGTSCRLVKFEGGDGKTLTPEDRSKYTITFEAEGRVSARVGLQPWDRCSPAPLNDSISKHSDYVRSYTFKDGHLFLSADGGRRDL